MTGKFLRSNLSVIHFPVKFARLTEFYEYEVLIFDQQRGRELVEAKAIEIDGYSWRMWRKLPACGFRTTF